MKFKDYVYERPDVKEVATAIEGFAEEIANAKSFASAKQALEQALELQDHYCTMAILCSIRHSINTEDS